MVKKILIVDDEPGILHILTKLIEKYQYIVITAKDGEEALNKVRTEHPDLMLLDMLMPVKSGMEVLNELQKVHNPMPVIIISNQDLSQYIDEAKTFGVLDYIIKSDNSLTQVIEKIEKAIGRSEA